MRALRTGRVDRNLGAVFRLPAVVVAALMLIGVSVPAIAAGTFNLRGDLVMADHADWHRLDGPACSGDGLYYDLRRGVRVRVLDGHSSKVLAVGRLGRGRIRRDTCTFGFHLGRVPGATVYRFEVGPPSAAGLFFTDTRDATDLVRAKGRVIFLVGAPEPPPPLSGGPRHDPATPQGMA